MSIRPDYAALAREVLQETSPPPPGPRTQERVLDAALVLVGRYGARRVTMDEVASEAGVARATVFRRFGSRDELIRQLFMREVRTTLWEVRKAIEGADDQLAVGFAALGDLIGRHPIPLQMTRAEPDLVVEMWRTGKPTGFALIRTFLEELAGPERRGQADVLARLLLSYYLLPEIAPDRAEMEAIVRRGVLA